MPSPTIFLSPWLLLLSISCVFNYTSHSSATTMNATSRHHFPLMKIMVGGYAGKITVLEYDPGNNTFRNLSSTATATNETTTRTTTTTIGRNPSFMTRSPVDQACFFAANEVSDFRDMNATGSVASFTINPHDNTLAPLSTALAAADPTALAISPDGRNLLAAEYTGGSWSRYSVTHQCRFTSEKPTQALQYHGSGPNKERQDHSYIHHAMYTPEGDLVLFVDLGGDSVYVHRVDVSTGHVGDLAHEIKFPPGTGPRHVSMISRGDGQDIYVISELSNQIFTIRVTDGGYGGLTSTIRQQLSTLPGNTTEAERRTFGAGEVMVSGDGRFVYGSNRQTDFSKPITDNSIVVFVRDPHTGLLLDSGTDYSNSNSPAWFPLPVGGTTPRQFSFSLDPYQSFLVVGCQQADTLLIFRRIPFDGSLRFLASTSVQAPSIQLFIPNHDQSYD
ncbi:hypothetical protein PCANC_03122 [Puccinia coronata f. sp. avenae]|uniref:6-phosphogluconolactonase n=1 Tax=Puccinia coronata f. sp. avenae TaxID=200324 RepID=A0A2N5W4P5_9BASI|nr:hypothetical protein PCANC_03122 [Puccinia coronata f. sp. avenae]